MRTTNEQVERLRERQRRERAALDAVTAAQSAVGAAQQRRQAAVLELDRAVVKAEQGLDVALSVLVSLMPEEETAAIAGVDVAAIRAARKRVGPQEARTALARLGAVRTGRRGRAAVQRPGGVSVGGVAGSGSALEV